MRYFFGFLVAVGLIIFIIVLMFGGGGSHQPITPSNIKPLDSYAGTDAEVSMTITGPVIADQDHKSLRITVGTNSVVYQQFDGYDGKVVNSKVFHNSEASYRTFLRALAYVGFANGNNDKSLQNESGRCSLGKIFSFDMRDDGNHLEHYWITSCGGPKTFLGNSIATISLFEAQVPNYGSLTSNLNL
ncbi:MAG TPA: hypothetical protein VG604_02640 [Candidatus Saccharimonadales bacterium]|nr:hypothetical protein [Candidatus Saccharimonadales bacterium]